MLRQIKLAVLQFSRAVGLFSIAIDSPWRNRRLLILCYHGVSLDDEHLWHPGLYIPSAQLRARLRHLDDRNANVLPFSEAICRLRTGTLPERAVAITFDDGFHDFHQTAWPALRKYSYPATVYLTTYYADNWQWPVFDPMLNYILRKSYGRVLDWPEIGLGRILLDNAGIRSVEASILAYCQAGRLSGCERNEQLAELSQRLEFDFQAVRQRRILSLMSPDEVRQVASEGADIQLHTHRHRVFSRRERFLGEIEINRSRIREYTGKQAEHFCYPGGYTIPEVPNWLRTSQVETATTCVGGLASIATNPYYLPRVLDTCSLSEIEFDAWLCGFAGILPMRKYLPAPTQLGVE